LSLTLSSSLFASFASQHFQSRSWKFLTGFVPVDSWSILRIFESLIVDASSTRHKLLVIFWGRALYGWFTAAAKSQQPKQRSQHSFAFTKLLVILVLYRSVKSFQPGRLLDISPGKRFLVTYSSQNPSNLQDAVGIFALREPVSFLEVTFFFSLIWRNLAV
jgi:hypothetical protein